MEGTGKSLNPAGWSYQGWRKFFALAALWNLTGAIPGILFPRHNLQVFYAVVTDDYITLFLNRGVWWAVLFFGIGYLIIAIDPARHWGIIVMGIIGKTVIALHWFYMFAIDRATAMAALAALGDSIFTVLFIYYLVRGPRSQKDEN